MPANDLVRIPDYNDIRNTIVAVMSTGSATQGYGQSINSSGAAVGDFVSKAEWDKLRYDIVNAIVHQTGSVPAITVVTESDLVRYDAAQPNFQYQTLANQANTNRFDVAAAQYVIEPRGSRSDSVSFSNSVRCSITVPFASANEARYFFNSGGKIRFSSSFSDTLGTSQSGAWTTLLSSLGTVSFGGNTPAVNFYTLTSSPQTFYSQGTSGTYSMNRWTLQASCNVANNSSGTASQVTFTSIWEDIYTDPGFPPPGDAVAGTMSITVSQLRAQGALYPNLVPASFSAPSPTSVTIGAIAP
jgi:hypothetical protein